MTCEQIEVWISAYQDGELDSARRRRVEDHLTTCCACRELVAEWTALERSLRTELTRYDAPETLHARVMRQIPDERPAAAPLGRRGSWTPGGWFTFGLAPIGALTAWMLWTGHVIAPQSGKTPQTQISAQVGPSIDSPGVIQTKVITPPAPGVGGNSKADSPKDGLRRDVVGPKPPSRSGPDRRGDTHGTRARRDPLRELRRLRSRRPYYRVAGLPPGHGYRRRSHPRHHRSDLMAANPPLPLVTVPQPVETPEHRLAQVPRFRVTDYVLPQVPAPTETTGSETEFVLRRAAATAPTQVAYEF